MAFSGKLLVSGRLGIVVELVSSFFFFHHYIVIAPTVFPGVGYASGFAFNKLTQLHLGAIATKLIAQVVDYGAPGCVAESVNIRPKLF